MYINNFESSYIFKMGNIEQGSVHIIPICNQGFKGF